MDENIIIAAIPNPKKKPPRLKYADRTISVQVENYTPIQKQHSPGHIVIEPPIIIEETDRLRLPPSTAITSPSVKPKIFYMGASTQQVPTNFEIFPYADRKSNFRRSDTLDVSTPAAYLLRKTNSFNANDEEFARGDLLAVRGSSNQSLRSSLVFPPEYPLSEPSLPIPPLTVIPKHSPRPDDSNRRNCRMHRSFVDRSIEPNRRNSNTARRDAIKCHSFNDDIYADPLVQQQQKDVKKFSSATASIESDLYRSRSNSRNRPDEEPYLVFVNRQSSKKFPQTKPRDEITLENKKMNFARGSRYAQSFYVNPERSSDELRVPRSLQDNRKIQSTSLKYRQTKENLSTTKKSKSFITEVHPVHERRDSAFFTTTEEFQKLQRSPILLDDINLSAQRSRKSSLTTYDPADAINFAARSFRKSQRRGSGTGAGTSGSGRRKSTKKKSSIADDDELDASGDNNNNQHRHPSINDAGEEEEEVDDISKRKRKKIVCIIMTVFLSLVFASVFVVVITLTHSSVAEVHNKTRKVYTFSRDSPLHYNNGNN